MNPTTLIAICMVILTLAILVGVGALLVMLSRETEVAEVHAQLAEMWRHRAREARDFEEQQNLVFELHNLCSPIYLQFDAWEGGASLREHLRRMKIIVPKILAERANENANAERIAADIEFVSTIASFAATYFVDEKHGPASSAVANACVAAVRDAIAKRAADERRIEREWARQKMIEVADQAADLVGIPRMDGSRPTKTS